MYGTYIKSALRNLWKQKLNAAINLTGLGIGLACCLLIGLYIAGELRYDRYHRNADRIWRITRSFLDEKGTVNLSLGSAAPPFGPLLKRDFPEFEEVTRVLEEEEATLRRNDGEVFLEKEAFYVEPNIFQVFDVPLVAGDAQTALSGPYQVLLSEKTARRYFGTADPLNRELLFNNLVTCRVTGVYRDFPVASHWHPDVLVSFATLNDSTVYGARRLQGDFSNNSFFTYALVGENFDAQKTAARFPAFVDAILPHDKVRMSDFTQLHLQRLTDIHLHGHFDTEIEANGDIRRVRTFAIVALLILLIACINYVNLSTAFSLTRAREIGVRKAAGAFNRQLVGQFLTESVVLAFGGMLIALALTALAFPLLRRGLGVELQADLLASWYVPAALFGAVGLVGAVAGLYPAFFLSSFRPARVLKGDVKTASGGIGLRKALVVAQFALSIALLAGTFVITRQLDYMQHKALGLDKERIVTFSHSAELARQWDAFRTELLASPLAVEVSRSSRQPSTRLLDDLGMSRVQLGDTLEKSPAVLRYLGVDHNFVPAYNLQLAAGRNFSWEFPTDTTRAFLINEAAARAIGWATPQEAVGKLLEYGGRKDARVVGVLRDFHFESLHRAIDPMIFLIPRRSTSFNQVAVKLGPDLPAALAHLEATYARFAPSVPLDYTFLDEQYGRLYESEQRQGRLFSVFAGLAIFIACLGLFGLVTFAAHQRMKELGIRKVLGASAASLVGLLSKDFLKLVAVAFVLAVPVAWWTMENWLQNFAYRMRLEWWIFALAGLAAVAIALLTVSAQGVKAALINPIKSLRSE
jgi:putative ABC transport system permease protein